MLAATVDLSSVLLTDSTSCGPTWTAWTSSMRQARSGLTDEGHPDGRLLGVSILSASRSMGRAAGRSRVPWTCCERNRVSLPQKRQSKTQGRTLMLQPS